MIDLKLDHVSKRYLIRHEADANNKVHPLLQKLSNLWNRPEEFWALRDVSFEVQRGEALGIIGRNGAGKSTILKLLANITRPTAGKITINGRLSALIEVGSGFHQDLTGRENIYLSGSILGMNRSEITRKLDSIIDFAGIRQFIDTPVKRYSSGMYVRLGFSIAAHLEPDILLLDEVLAVGDGAFQLKCMNRIKELEHAGTTIVFISHDLRAIERVCDRVILLKSGEIVACGPPSEVIKVYDPPRKVDGKHQRELLIFNNLNPNAGLKFEVERIEVVERDGSIKHELRTGDYVRFRISWRSDEILEQGGVELGIRTLDGVPLIQYSTRPVSTTDVRFYQGRNSIELVFDEFPLASGDYQLSAGLTIPMVTWLHRVDSFGLLHVKENDILRSGFPLESSCSVLAVPHQWIVAAEEQEGVSPNVNVELFS